MIRVQTRRAGLIWLAATSNDNGDVHQTWGFTESGAFARLCRREVRMFGGEPQ